MTTTERQAEIPETFYGKLLSFVDEQDELKEIRNHYSEIEVCKADQECINFCKELSKKWIIRTLSSLVDIKTANEEKIRFLNLRKDCSTECDIQIYSYFLYFCGILFLLTKEEDKAHRDTLRMFFESKIQSTEDSNRRLLFRFLTAYIDLIDPEKDNIIVFQDLKECLTDDDDKIIFGAIEKEHELMMEILRETHEMSESRLNEKIKKVFPTIERRYIKNNGENIIDSIIRSGIARLYFIAGRESEHIAKLTEALPFETAFPYNSFALVQTAYLAVKFHKALEVLDAKKELDEEDERLNNLFTLVKTANIAVKVKASNKDYLGASEDLFEKVIKLIDEDKQFSGYEPFNFRIKFEALLGLAYIYHLKGLHARAERKYQEAMEIIDGHLSGNENNQEDNEDNQDEYCLKNPNNLDEHYLKSILWICRGRERLENGSFRDNSDAKRDFLAVLKTYEAAPIQVKDELAEIAARAHNNLGIYYLNEADYEKAEEHFKKSLDMDDTSPHARYNLGVLYYRKDEQARALTLFRNAYNLDSKFSEARDALEKLGAMKKGSLGSDWFDWWFENKQKTKGTIRIANKKLSINKRVSIRSIVAVAIIIVMIIGFGTLAYDLYLENFVNRIILSNGASMGSHDVDENAFLIIFAISIIILMLPFINKLKMSDVEIELETAGYRPVGPASVTAGFQFQEDYSIRLPFFFARFWY
jgi:tetratricopeptide (TPR) repeat protein